MFLAGAEDGTGNCVAVWLVGDSTDDRSDDSGTSLGCRLSTRDGTGDFRETGWLLDEADVDGIEDPVITDVWLSDGVGAGDSCITTTE